MPILQEPAARRQCHLEITYFGFHIDIMDGVFNSDVTAHEER
jgi:pentose-5-phosphate-3-epimerase